jgi:hypothetical protein
LSLAFEWCAFAAGWRALRAASSARDASFLEDPDALDALSLRARAAQVDLLRRRTFPELTLFLVPFAAARVASAARDAARAILGDAGASSAVFSSVASVAAAVSETYQAAVFFAACASFRLACGMALFRLNAFLTRFEDWGRPARAAETGDASPVARRGSSSGEFSPDSLNDVAAQASEDSVRGEVFLVGRRARPTAHVPETRREEVPAFPAGDVDVRVRGDRARGARRREERQAPAPGRRRAATRGVRFPRGVLGSADARDGRSRVVRGSERARGGSRDAQAAARRRIRVAQARGNHRRGDAARAPSIARRRRFARATPRSAFFGTSRCA